MTSKAVMSQAREPAQSQRVLGIVLLVLALVCCGTELLVPTLRTLWFGFRKVDFLGRGGGFVGLQNYATLLQNPQFGAALGLTLLILGVRLLVVAVVPPLLAWAVSRLRRPWRRSLRVVLTLPVVLWVPVAIAVAWVLVFHPTQGWVPGGASLLVNPTSARLLILFIDALYVFGLACGLGLTVYLPLWRRPEGVPPPTFREIRTPLLVTWGVSVMAVVALSLSTFVLPFVMTGGGPRGRMTTLGKLIFDLAFTRFHLGPAAALASLMLLVTLALGLASGLLILRARMRLNLVDALPSPLQATSSTSSERSAVPSLVLVLALGCGVLGLLPVLGLVPRVVGSGGFATLLERLPVGRILVNSLIPPQIAAAAQLAVAYLVALGIGALRPLGKRSEWLLLAFSPWLWVPLLPLSLVGFMDVRQAGLLNTFLGLIPPTLFNVPALFVLTLFFAGRVPRWRAALEEGKTDANAFLKHVIGPSLPLAAILYLFLFFVNWQDVVWPLIAGTDPRHQTLGVALFALLIRSQVAPGVLAAGVLLYIVPNGLIFVLLALLQVLYLDRLVGYRAPEPDVPPEAPASGSAAPQ